MPDETGGIINPEEGRGPKEEGFNRFVTLLLALFDSKGSRRCIIDVDGCKGEGNCMFGTTGDATLAGMDNGEIDPVAL